MVELLKSVQSNRSAGFSEVFIRSSAGEGVFRFVTDRHSYWLYTTNPMDLATLARTQKELGLSLQEAIGYLAKQDR